MIYVTVGLTILVVVSFIHSSHYSRLNYLEDRVKALEKELEEETDDRSLRELARAAVDYVDETFVDSMKRRHQQGLPKDIREEAKKRAISRMNHLVDQSVHDTVSKERMEILIDEEIRKKRNSR